MSGGVRSCRVVARARFVCVVDSSSSSSSSSTRLDSTRHRLASCRVVPVSSRAHHSRSSFIHSFASVFLSFQPRWRRRGTGAQGLEYTISFMVFVYPSVRRTRGTRTGIYIQSITHTERDINHIMMVLSHLHYASSPPYTRPDTSIDVPIPRLDDSTRVDSTRRLDDSTTSTRHTESSRHQRSRSINHHSWVDACDDTRGR